MHTNDQVFLSGENGIGIVLIHGVTSGAAQMVPLGRVLNEYGYSVHCVNIAGHLMPLNEGRFELIEYLIPWLNEMDLILD